MVAWSLSFLFLFRALALFGDDLSGLGASLGIGKQRAVLKKACAQFQEIEETLGAGLLPEAPRWAALAALPSPWGALAGESVQELRERGGALLPTLRRLRSLAGEHEAALADAKARSAQALSQALACAALVPLFGSALYFLLPGVPDRPFQWMLGSLIALAGACAGGAWIVKLAESARWAGLPADARPWVLASQCAGERFLALVRAGSPADLAWMRACELLSAEAPRLAREWGTSLWQSPARSSSRLGPAEIAIIQAGDGLRKAVQVSVMEGRPCAERVEVALQSLRQEVRAQMDRELSLLGTRALKPLFLCVAPALLGLLVFGLWITWESAGGGALGF